MEVITLYWLPIIVSAVVVFIASSLAWMVLPHHKADVRALPDEAELTAVLEKLKLPPGTYMWPNCEDAREMSSEAFQARFEAGPWGSINILPDKPNMGKNLAGVFLFYLVLSVLVAYVTGEAREPGAGFAPVFQIAATVAIIGYCFGSIPNAIFFGKPLRFMVTDFVDGLVYGILTGIVFAALWPGAT